MPDYEEYCKEIKELWDSHWLTNMGKKHKQLQSELETMLNVPHVTLYVNGHLALENVIASFNFPKGSEVITTPFTLSMFMAICVMWKKLKELQRNMS